MRVLFKLSVLFCALAAAVPVGVVAAAGVAHAALGGIVIMNYNTQGCLTVQSGSTAPGTPIVQWRCDNRFGQRWILEGAAGGIREVRSLDTGLCLDITNFNNFGSVVQEDCGSGHAGLFWSFIERPRGFYDRAITLKSYTTNYCLDLENGDHADGVPLQVWSCNYNTNNQIWGIISV